MVLPQYKDTTLLCRSFAEQLANTLLPVNLELRRLKCYIKTGKGLDALNRTLNQLQQASDIVAKIALVGRTSDNLVYTVEEVVSPVIEWASLKRWDFPIRAEVIVVYNDNVSFIKISNADILHCSLIEVLHLFLQTMFDDDIMEGSINISVGQEEALITLRMTSSEIILSGGKDYLSWPEGVEHKETTLPYVRFLLETKGGSLTVEGEAFVFKFPIAQ